MFLNILYAGGGEKHYGVGLLMSSIGLMGDVFRACANSSFAKREAPAREGRGFQRYSHFMMVPCSKVGKIAENHRM